MWKGGGHVWPFFFFLNYFFLKQFGGCKLRCPREIFREELFVQWERGMEYTGSGHYSLCHLRVKVAVWGNPNKSWVVSSDEEELRKTRQVTLVACFIPLLSAPSWLAWDASKFRKQIKTEPFRRRPQAHTDVYGMASVPLQQQDRLQLLLSGSGRTLQLPFVLPALLHKHRQPPPLALMIKSNYWGDSFSFNPH